MSQRHSGDFRVSDLNLVDAYHCEVVTEKGDRVSWVLWEQLAGEWGGRKRVPVVRNRIGEGPGTRESRRSSARSTMTHTPGLAHGRHSVWCE